jgi:GTP-binding protein HflX
MLADTVGFIHRLPHLLIEAFKATLEEVRTADLLLHVIDASSPLLDERMEIVDQVLAEIGAGDKPRLLVLNKIDLMAEGIRPRYGCDGVALSALRREGLDDLLEALARGLSPLREELAVTLPSGRGDLIAMARRDGEIVAEEYSDGVVALRARVSPAVAGRLRKAAVTG